MCPAPPLASHHIALHQSVSHVPIKRIHPAIHTHFLVIVFIIFTSGARYLARRAILLLKFSMLQMVLLSPCCTLPLPMYPEPNNVIFPPSSAPIDDRRPITGLRPTLRPARCTATYWIKICGCKCESRHQVLFRYAVPVPGYGTSGTVVGYRKFSVNPYPSAMPIFDSYASNSTISDIQQQWWPT